MSSSAPKLCVDDVSMTFKTPTGVFQALAPVTLSIPQGRFVSLIGPSGCGESTIFNIIAGLLEPTAGRVLIDGVDATGTIGRVGYMHRVHAAEACFELRILANCMPVRNLDDLCVCTVDP